MTPVWNEAWILDRFLACASLWADQILIADQDSNDGSREIARNHPKVTLIQNASPAYDERARQKILIDAARTIPGPRVLVALDADEALSANVCRSDAWRAALSAAPGTVIRLPWVNLLHERGPAWVPSSLIAFGYVDDDQPHAGLPIHSTRVPSPQHSPTFDLTEVVVLHYQYLDDQRMRAKQRWYQCHERLESPNKRPAEIYRQYHHMDSRPAEEIAAVDPSWIEGFAEAEISDFTVSTRGADTWHRRILDLFGTHGPASFRKVDIWDVDWASEAKRLGVAADPTSVSDPRSRIDRIALRWLRFAQPRRNFAVVRALSRSLRVVGW